MYAASLALILAVSILAFSLSSAGDNADSRSEVVAVDELEWGYLNPARGSAGPAAADLWGDRTRDTASGILLRFPEGFESPAHIHNITYRGVVISGELHNDDPAANSTWMPAGSFWVQPAGGVHITAANGKENIAYIEIDNGPYLVLPTVEAFDAGQSPVNVSVSDIAWSGSTEAVSVGKTGAEIARLWGDYSQGEVFGTLLKIPAGFSGKISTTSPTWRAIVIQGDLIYHQESGEKKLRPGSYFGSSGASDHSFDSGKEQPTVLYVSSDGSFRILSR